MFVPAVVMNVQFSVLSVSVVGMLLMLCRYMVMLVFVSG